MTFPMETTELKELLEHLHDKYNNADFIAGDPISIPHSFSGRDDIEISGFLASTIAWGNRKAIVKSARRMVECMDGQPYDFTLNASDAELSKLHSFVHRTFNGTDFETFVRCIRALYAKYGGIGRFFETRYAELGDMRGVLSAFRSECFAASNWPHCEKHVSSIDNGAACKRLNMYIRWMVRRDCRGVDFGLWNSIPASALYLPLDVHSGNMGRALGLLTRKQSDWKAVEQITASLRAFDADDPVKYDFSLFGAGIDGYLK